MSIKNKLFRFCSEIGVILLAFIGLFLVGLALSFCLSGGVISIYSMCKGNIHEMFNETWKINFLCAFLFAFMYLFYSLIQAIKQFKKRKDKYNK